MIVGPEDVLSSNEVNKPAITDIIPTKVAKKTIWFGLLLIFLAVAAGIKSNPVINKAPIIFIERAITPANRRVNMKFVVNKISYLLSKKGNSINAKIIKVF